MNFENMQQNKIDELAEEELADVFERESEFKLAKEEKIRSEDYDSCIESVQEYISTLTDDNRKNIFEEISQNIDSVEEFLRESIEDIKCDVNIHTRESLKLFKNKLKELEQIDQRRYNNLINDFIDKFSGETFIRINEVLSYGISKDEKLVHIHVVPSREKVILHGRDGIKKLKELFIQGLQDLAVIIKEDSDIEYVTATSQMVKKNPKLIKKLGFTDEGMINDELWKKHFSQEKQSDIHYAEINRELFLEKYLNNIE